MRHRKQVFKLRGMWLPNKMGIQAGISNQCQIFSNKALPVQSPSRQAPFVSPSLPRLGCAIALCTPSRTRRSRSALAAAASHSAAPAPPPPAAPPPSWGPRQGHATVTGAASSSAPALTAASGGAPGRCCVTDPVTGTASVAATGVVTQAATASVPRCGPVHIIGGSRVRCASQTSAS